ncbi:uncharacterized protein B0T23DRAFT_38817 [Neurospora hispaniola]|uniref:Uncharacterized protein n=1 Tax=Neurospora hispaniola TaxID=588809 RepID=A0AAJ0IH08_9PEZI|nr:hypothetical protein B0T23DRAFT_38817 [Neurospora hispaniola]
MLARFWVSCYGLLAPLWIGRLGTRGSSRCIIIIIIVVVLFLFFMIIIMYHRYGMVYHNTCNRHTDTHTHKQTNRQTDRQTDKWNIEQIRTT